MVDSMCIPSHFQAEILLRTEPKPSTSQQNTFKCFQLTDLLLNRKLAPELELDVLLRTQLTNFPTNWNLGNSAAPVNYVLMHTLHCMDVP